MGRACSVFVPQLGYAAVKDAGQVGTSFFARQLSGKVKCKAPARLDILGRFQICFGCLFWL